MVDKLKNKNELHDENINDVVEKETLENVEEATEPKGGSKAGPRPEGEVDEKDSLDSSKKAEQSTKKTSLPNGGKGQDPKTKAGIINAMYTKFSKMNKEELTTAYEKVIGEKLDDSDLEDITETKTDVKKELKNIVDSENTLSEDFKSKTAILFETALNEKIAEEVSRIEEDYKNQLESEKKEIREDLETKIDSYLNYAVQNWMDENKVAIQNGLRTEIAENFMEKLKGIFEESYIEVPEGKIDLVDELAEDNKELETQLNDATSKLISMSEQLENYKKDEVIRENCGDLSVTQVEKVKDLLKGSDFDDEESFKSKVETIKESYFSKESKKPNQTVITEDMDSEEEEVELSDTMAKYVSALKRVSPKKV